MLTTRERQAIRAECETWLPSTATLYQPTSTPDGGGGWTDTYVEGATLACRLAPVGGGEGARTGDRVDERTTHMLTLPHSTVIEEADQIAVDGVRYEAMLVRKRPHLEFTRRVEVREVA